MIEYTFFYRCDGCGVETLRTRVACHDHGLVLEQPEPPDGWIWFPRPVGLRCVTCRATLELHLRQERERVEAVKRENAEWLRRRALAG